VVKALVVDTADTHTVVIDAEVQHDLDLTSIESLEQFVEWARGRGVDVRLASVHDDLRARFDASGITELLGADHLHPAVADAVQAANIRPS